ncbi:GcrA family cell cycle regulator [Nguyenibacter sp. L1]|nr:GcrA family cell cycle regulator [Nguyenibacter sp. L1]WRH87295.1 GcrA family cell cycle regulator [Nguyenibacter sp. L1]
MAMEWTEETIARLRELWQQGLSTAEIGRQLAVTKNAVVGKAHRLGLQSRPSPIRRPAAPARATESRGMESKPVAAAAPASAAAPTANVTPLHGDAPKVAPIAAAPIATVPVVAETVSAEVRPVPGQIAASAAVAPGGPTPDAPAVAPAAAPAVAPVPAVAARQGASEAGPAETRVEARPPLRAVGTPAPRRSGLTCCWPLGDPGTPGFHFCGATPVPGKPYCAEHAQLAYVKLRDRRDNVA